MDSATITTIIIFVLGILGVLIGLVYSNLNKQTTENKDDIKTIRETFVTKEDSNRANDRLEVKLDKIIDMLIEGGRQ